VNPPRELKVYMQLGPPDEPIRGELEHPSGERTAFSGWIALVAAIEAARTATRVGGRPVAGGDEERETAPAQDRRASGAGGEPRI
jgi:hypothetical protein